MKILQAGYQIKEQDKLYPLVQVSASVSVYKHYE
jgi:hypothetical protein